MRALDRYYDVLVTGAGAAGMVAAVNASSRGRKVLLLEKSDRPGRKITASGNGRCNLMNSGEFRYYGDSQFAKLVLKACSRDQLTAFFRRHGLLVTEENDGRIYPMTYQSATVLSALKKALEITGVHMETGIAVVSAQQNGDRFLVETANGQTIESGKLVIACGGAAQPKLGGTFDGFRILQNMGHRMIPVKPSLVPLVTDPKSISGLAGIRVRCCVSLIGDGKTIHNEKGEVLFTDYGISGICVMQCARFAVPDKTYLELDLISGAFPDSGQAVQEMSFRRKHFADSSPVWLLNGILPEKLSYAVLKQAGMPLRGESAGAATDRMLEKITETACHYRIEIKGTRGFEQAQVTAGGIDCREFNHDTMESRIVPGLYAVGEVLNVDGDCGGFNLMFAFASGWIAGESV